VKLFVLTVAWVLICIGVAGVVLTGYLYYRGDFRDVAESGEKARLTEYGPSPKPVSEQAIRPEVNDMVATFLVPSAAIGFFGAVLLVIATKSVWKKPQGKE
jgi:hypothetical protein